MIRNLIADEEIAKVGETPDLYEPYQLVAELSHSVKDRKLRRLARRHKPQAIPQNVKALPTEVKA